MSHTTQSSDNQVLVAKTKKTKASARFELGHFLGKGAFASVYTANLRRSTPSEHPKLDRTECMDQESGSGILPVPAENEDMNAAMPQRCVVKKIRHSARASNIRREMARDLSAEAITLQRLPSHRHIISLIGTSQNLDEKYEDFDRSSSSNPSSAFLILERLEDTLEDRLRRWSLKQSRVQQQERSKRRPGSKIFRSSKSKEEERKRLQHEQYERIASCAVGIVKALKHLHDHKIIYRDLKPGNVGFDSDGTVKIFDFGLSQSIHQEGADMETDGAIGCTGTPRYIAPESLYFCLNENAPSYSFSADVYSFAMLLWQICTLQKPFGELKNFEALKKAVLVKKSRPSLDGIACPQVRQLLEACWAQDPGARPTFDQVQDQLESILADTEQE